MVDGAFRRAGGASDVVERGVLVAVFSERHTCRFEQSGACRFSLLSPQAGGAFDGVSGQLTAAHSGTLAAFLEALGMACGLLSNRHMASYAHVRIWVPLLLIGVLAGCSGDDDSEGAAACDPLKSSGSASLKLEHVLGIGKAEDGRFFVVDRPKSGSERLFVSSDGSLVRRDGGGGASSSTEPGIERMSLSSSGDDGLIVLIELRGSAVRMAILEGAAGGTKELSVDRSDAELLTIADESEIAGMPVRDLPGDVALEYSAQVDDGERLIVTRPEHDWSYEDFRVFFGPKDHVAERTVVNVTRARDGGSTNIRFKVGELDAEVFFPNRLTGDGGESITEPVTLTIGSKQFGIERLPQDAPEIDGLEFRCFE